MSDVEVEQAGRRPEESALSERVLVRAPTADDAALIAQILADRYDVVVLDSVPALVREWDVGAGVILIASEALSEDDCCAVLRRLLESQEAWSEIPVLVFGGADEEQSAWITEMLGDRGQTLILERPLGIATFRSAVEGALRSRRRQYEVKRLLDELADSAVAVERAHQQADRAKDEFLATLGHELRSPMTAIRGWIQLLKAGELDSAESADALSMMEASTKVQAHIIEDLMDVSRILAGKAMIEPTVIELEPVVANVVATFRPAAEEQGLTLTADVPGEPVLVFADMVRLQQIGWNLVSNAIKFTPAGGSVCVTLRAEEGRAVIRVSDTGRGISADLLPHVFERYRQEEAAPMKERRGLGLGLAIVRHLVESHGGTIEAFSRGLGEGSEFVLSLPLHHETKNVTEP